MTVHIEIAHPAHVHLFRHFITYLKSRRIKVIVTSRHKDVSNQLLDHYKIDYQVLSTAATGFLGLIWEFAIRALKIFRLHRQHHFKMTFGTSPVIALLTLFFKVRSYNFSEDDDDIVPLYAYTGFPISTKVIMPRCTRFSYWKKKRILHESYHELAYLHPEHFQPEQAVVAKYGLVPKKYIIFRLSALKAHHDAGAKGLGDELLGRIKISLKDYTLVLSKEGEKQKAFEPHDMHHILAHTKMIISDSQTMSAEAAVLGIPAIRYNSFVGRISYLEELEHRYQLTFGFKPGEEVQMEAKILSLIQDPNLEVLWQVRREKMLSEKVNFNQWMINFFEKERLEN